MMTCKKCGFSDDTKDKCIEENHELTILNLQLNLQYEQMKNKIFTEIIEKQINIKLEDIIKESGKQINIHDFIHGNTQILLNQTQEPLKKPKKKPKKKIEEENELVIEIEEGVAQTNASI
jgi:hypothetical protein